jgi:hypothetical protein
MSLYDAGLLTIGLTTLSFGLVGGISAMRSASFNSGYWKGRAAGWESHRRLTNTIKKTDEVFDYEKH